MAHGRILFDDVTTPGLSPPMWMGETVDFGDHIQVKDDAATEVIPMTELRARALCNPTDPNRIARQIVLDTWPHARIRRTDLILNRRMFRMGWEQQRDLARASRDVALTATAAVLVDAVDRLPAQSLVCCVANIEGQAWEIFVDTDETTLLAAWQRPRLF
jgi:hypothetical protein